MTIPFSILEDLDRTMVAERDRAAVEGPGVWAAKLREEAITKMIEMSGASRAEVERDLDAFVAASDEDTVTTLEQLVYEMRFLNEADRRNEGEA